MTKMIVSKFIAITLGACLALSLSQSAFVAAVAEEPMADVVGEASSPSPKSPIRVKVVDYAKAEEGPGTLKLSGTAIAGNKVHIYVDDKPFAEVLAGSSDGAWSVEDKIPLDDTVHSVRVEQFDKETSMLSGRAMFSISLRPPTPEELTAPPVGRP
ncbi:MAG: hypothetical protein ACTSYK_05005 [Alphaproteobacteria bacterium]